MIGVAELPDAFARVAAVPRLGDAPEGVSGANGVSRLWSRPDGRTRRPQRNHHEKGQGDSESDETRTEHAFVSVDEQTFACQDPEAPRCHESVTEG